MSTLPDRPTIYYCLTCGGTGIRGGRLSGKKKCKTCKGTGHREVLFDNKDRTVLDDFKSVTVPACFCPDVDKPKKKE